VARKYFQHGVLHGTMSDEIAQRGVNQLCVCLSVRRRFPALKSPVQDALDRGCDRAVLHSFLFSQDCAIDIRIKT